MIKHFKRIAGVILSVAYFALLNSCEPFESYQIIDVDPPAFQDHIDSLEAMEIVSELTALMNEKELLGMQICVAHQQHGFWSVSLGTTGPDQEDSIENDHVLRIGSVTKIYTATLIFRLIEDGYLQLEQDISEFFPNENHMEDVTIEQLLAHTSGIRDIFTMTSVLVNASNFPDKQWDPHQVAKACMKKQLLFEPGTDYSYSNTNYIILGLIAEQVSGMTLAQLYNAYIFNPLELEQTCFVPYERIPGNLISGFVHHYALSLTEWYPSVPGNTSWPTLAYSSGAMVTSAMELAAFLNHLLSGDLLLPQSMEEMTGGTDGRGKGLASIGINGNAWFGHEGEITGFESMALFQPETGWIITVITNTTPFHIKEAVSIIEKRI